MKRKVWLLVTVTFVLMLLIVPVIQAAQLKSLIVRVRVQEQLNWGDPRLPAPAVTCVMLALPYGIPVAWGVTNSQGTVILRGDVYDDERFCVYVVRSKPAGPFGLTIPHRYSQQIPVDVATSWFLVADYTHNTARMIMGYFLIY